MTRILIIILICLYNYSFAQNINTEVIDAKGNAKLLGKITKEGLLKTPYQNWYTKNYEAYDVNTSLTEKLNSSLSDYEIKVFLGTWCGDSKREVPRLYKVLESADFPENQLEIIALDNTNESYKQSPNNEQQGLNIHRVPTVIIYKDGKEINRIVESPVETFERDLIKITSDNKYISNYMVVNYMEGLLNSQTIESLKDMEATLIKRLPEFVTGSKELNTYGYVKLRSNQIEKALYIFDLNTKMFPNNMNTFDSLAEAYYVNKDYEKALMNYHKILVEDPTNQNAKNMISEITNIIDSADQ